MPKDSYGSTQVREVKFTKDEVHRMVLENFLLRSSQPYNFDYKRPIIVEGSDGELIFRFVESEITREHEPRALQFASLAESVDARARKLKTPT